MVCTADFADGNALPHKGCDLLNPICDDSGTPVCLCKVGDAACDVTTSSRCDVTDPAAGVCMCGASGLCMTATIPACLTATQMTPDAGDGSATCQVFKYLSRSICWKYCL